MEAVKKKKKAKLKTREDSGLALSHDETSSLTSEPIEPADDVKTMARLKSRDQLFNPEEKENLLKNSSSLSHVAEPVNSGMNSLDSIESFATELEEVRANVAEMAVAPEPDEDTANLLHYRVNPLDGGEEEEEEESIRNYREPCTVRVVLDDFTEFSELSSAIGEKNEISPFTDAQLASLYNNEEIGLCHNLIDNFIDQELNSGVVQRHVLYDLLCSYLRCKEKQDSTVAKVEELIKESKNAQLGLWILEMAKIGETGECQDGNPVEASHTFQIGRFDAAALSRLTKTLALVRENANDEYALDSYTFLVTKLKIDHYIRSMTTNFSNISHNAPVSLLNEGTTQKTSEICSAISVFFHFLRQPCKDQGFINDIRQWLTTLVAVLLRAASWKEHMFILCHVLRCPSTAFKWTACFVQAPLASSVNHRSVSFLNHMLAMLTTIVSTVKSRDVFISPQNKSVDDGDDLWVLVDSDGEDEEDNKLDLLHLRESDIVSLLNQIPFDSLFRQIFDVKTNEGSDCFNGMTGGQLLQVFAILRLLIRILNHGLSNYGTNKYVQFSKRLASLILHATQYATDALETFKRDNHENTDVALRERLQVEYNNIIVSACNALIHSEQKNVLQFLISLPFSSVSLRVLWQMFHMVMMPHRSGITCNSGIEWWSGVEELIPSLSDAELCYVLNAVANMALSRSSDDWLFVKVVTIHLLQIGFINSSTKELCYKTCRTLISNLCSKYPSLISVILNKLKNILPQAENLSLYLFKEIPVNLWRPTKDDLRLIEHWLLACPQGSIESSLAMFILHGMNWNFTPGSSTELFLPREIHCEVALLIVRFAILHCPESPSSSHSTVIADTIKQLTGSSSRSATEQTLNVWVWSMLFKLRLHLLDQPEPTVRTMLANPIQFFSILPSLESLPNELSPLIRALKENQVVAMFTALLMTSTGHSIPLICQSGFQMMKVLMQCHRYMAVLVLLQHIFPLFLECPSSLLQCDKFQVIILGLLGADRTFLKFAMSIISTDFPGLILKQMGDLIEVHFENYRQYNLVSPAPLIELWLKVLVSAWTHEPMAASYLMDKVLKAAFFCNGTRPVAKGLLLQLLEAQLNSHKPKFSLLSWVYGNNPYGTLMNKTSSNTPWFSFFAIEVEEELLFLKTGLWKHLLLDLSNSSSKVSLDAALKKACAAKNLAGLPSSILPIYRWSQQALDTPVDHPVMPVFWQKFFALYLARIPNMSHKDYGSVGMRFFEGITNSSFLKRLKKKLTDCKDFFESKLSNPCLTVTKERKDWFESMARLYSTYLLWLEEVVLHDPNLNLLNLPPPYASQKLSLVFQEIAGIWFEYVDCEAVTNVQKQSSVNWQRCLWRTVVDNAASKPPPASEIEPSTRIVQRLRKYENPLPAPFLQPFRSEMEQIPPEALYNKFVLLEILKGSFKALNNYARAFNRRREEHLSLDYSFLELTSLLYKTTETQITLHAACDTHSPGSHARPSVNSLNCAGPAVIHLKVNETQVDKQVDLVIHNNRLEAQALVKRCMQQPNQSVCIASIQVQLAVKALEKKYSELRMIGDVQLLTALHDVGLGLFYQFTSLFNEEVASYPPMKQLITSCVETLGQCFVSSDENQGPILLSLILQNPSLAGLLSTHFSPTTCSPNLYIQMYKTLISSLSSSIHDFMFVLLTKFDVSQWIEIQKPRMAERCQLIDLVGEALSTIGQDPPQELTMIHEVLRRQLCILMMTDPSQHVIQVIRMALLHSESHSLANEVWLDIVNALLRQTGVHLKPHSTLAQVVNVMETFAVNQTVLFLPELREIITLLSQYFIDERLQYGLYGLYPKYRKYISPFTALFSAFSYSLIVATVRHCVNSPASLPDEIWPFVSGLFSPWVCPYFTETLNQPTAAWIQQLTDDRSVLLPWISVDSGHAHKMVAIFTESIRFYLECNSVSGDLLGYVWSYYVNYFAHPSVKEYILSVMNNNFLSLPWNRFLPKISDLDLMLKVSDSYVPFCHSLLGAIFIEVPWMAWIENTQQISPTSAAKIHSSLLHLLVKLTNEPSVRQSGKILELLRASKSLKWECIDGNSYDAIVNWFVMSYNPKVIFNLDDEDSVADIAVMELLRYAAGFVHGKGHPVATTRKRQIYVRASVKLLVTCFSKYKTFASSHQAKVQTAIDDLLILINTVVPQSGGTYAEASLYVAELFTLVNVSNSNLVRISIDSITSWLSKRGDCVVSSAILKTLGTSVENCSILGEICESALEAIFNERSGGNWEYVLERLQDPALGQGKFEETLMDEGRFLTIYGFLRKKLFYQHESSEELLLFTNLALWMSNVKPICEQEAKMIPLFHLALFMASRLAEENPIVCERNLRMTVQTADSWSEFKPSWGFLGAIGLKKPSALSNRCKILMRILSSLILTQLPERKKELPTDQPPFIRTTADAPGGLTSNNIELGPHADTLKAVSHLESSLGNKTYVELRNIIEISLGFIRKTENSLHNGHQLYLRAAKLLYPEMRYLQCITIGMEAKDK